MPLILDRRLPRDPGAAPPLALTPDDAARQRAAPLRLLVLDLGRPALETGLQILRLLANYPLQVEVLLAGCRAGDAEALVGHAPTTAELLSAEWDAVVAVGDDLDLGPETAALLDEARARRAGALLIGAPAAAALARYHGLGIERSAHGAAGVVVARVAAAAHPLVAGLDDEIALPLSRDWAVRASSLPEALTPLAASAEGGVHLAYDRHARWLHVLDRIDAGPATVARALRRRGTGDGQAVPPAGAWSATAHHLVQRWLTCEVYLPGSLSG